VSDAGPSTASVLPTASVEQVLAARAALVIDVRAPIEHAEDRFPGALNLPLFDDAERALIGTLYRQQSPEVAFEQGRALLRTHIEPLVRAIAERAGCPLQAQAIEERFVRRTAGGLESLLRELSTAPVAALDARPIVIACWRGGMRSRSLALFLRELGLGQVVVLEGGYRAWRKHVSDGLAAWSASMPTFVLRGWTGVGKTLVLRAIERERPDWVLDLEALAGHRSSILGMVGLRPATQKTFESRLWRRCAVGFGAALVLEGESRKVGDVIVPPRIWDALTGGTCIELVASTERRVDVLIEDYLEHEANRAELRERLPFIEQRIGPVQWHGKLVALLDGRNERELVRVLLERYYDPLYRHSEKEFAHALRIDATDPERAASECIAWIEARGRPQRSNAMSFER
jgi:tRNA 2-selenouridine synthase